MTAGFTVRTALPEWLTRVDVAHDQLLTAACQQDLQAEAFAHDNKDLDIALKALRRVLYRHTNIDLYKEV